MECLFLGVRRVSPSNPTILVVLPTLGQRLASLERALASASAQAAEVALRIVVIAPSSSSAVKKLATRYGADFVADPGRGMSAAINAGLATRTTERYSIWLGDDDLYRPSGLLALQQLLDSHPQAVVAYGGCDYVDDAGETLWTSRAGSLARTLLGYGPNLIPHLAALIRVDAIEAVGGYDESLRLVMDLDLFLRLKKSGPFVHTRHVISAFGWHDDSLTVGSRAPAIGAAAGNGA